MFGILPPFYCTSPPTLAALLSLSRPQLSLCPSLQPRAWHSGLQYRNPQPPPHANVGIASSLGPSRLVQAGLKHHRASPQLQPGDDAEGRPSGDDGEGSSSSSDCNTSQSAYEAGSIPLLKLLAAIAEWPGHTRPASCLRDFSTSPALTLATAWDLVGTSIGEGCPEQVLPSPQVTFSSFMLPSGYPAARQLQLASHMAWMCSPTGAIVLYLCVMSFLPLSAKMVVSTAVKEYKTMARCRPCNGRNQVKAKKQ